MEARECSSFIVLELFATARSGGAAEHRGGRRCYDCIEPRWFREIANRSWIRRQWHYLHTPGNWCILLAGTWCHHDTLSGTQSSLPQPVSSRQALQTSDRFLHNQFLGTVWLFSSSPILSTETHCHNLRCRQFPQEAWTQQWPSCNCFNTMFGIQPGRLYCHEPGINWSRSFQVCEPCESLYRAHFHTRIVCKETLMALIISVDRSIRHWASSSTSSCIAEPQNRNFLFAAAFRAGPCISRPIEVRKGTMWMSILVSQVCLMNYEHGTNTVCKRLSKMAFLKLVNGWRRGT